MCQRFAALWYRYPAVNVREKISRNLTICCTADPASVPGKRQRKIARSMVILNRWRERWNRPSRWSTGKRGKTLDASNSWTGSMVGRLATEVGPYGTVRRGNKVLARLRLANWKWYIKRFGKWMKQRFSSVHLRGAIINLLHTRSVSLYKVGMFTYVYV